MKLREIKNRLEGDFEVGEQIKDKFFIGALTYLQDANERIERWELNYYDPKTEKVLRYVVDEEGYDVYEGKLANDVSELPKNLEYFVDEEEALNLAHEKFMNDYSNKEIVGVLIALDMIKEAWLISLITKELTAIQYAISLDGSKIESKEVHLVANP